MRINSVDAKKLATEDMQVLLGGTKIPSTILVPKVEHVHQLEWVGRKFPYFLLFSYFII